MAKFRFALFSAAVCFAFTDTMLGGENVDPQLQKDVFAGWAELERIDGGRPAVDSAWTVHESGGGRPEGTRSGIGRYRHSGESLRIEGEGDDRVEAFVLNSRYVFCVARDSNTHAWTLRFVETDLVSTNAKQLQDGWLSAKVIAPTAAIVLGSALRQQRKPSALADDPDFKMTNVERLPDGLIKLHYQHRLLVGEFDCDPAANYIIKRGRSREKGKRLECNMTFERHFGPMDPDGRANVERLVSEVVDTPGSTRKNETTYTYPDVSRTGELDEERFRLSAYGLPEPEGIVWEKPRRWLPYWLAGTGVSIVLVTTWLLRRARRTRPAEKRP